MGPPLGKGRADDERTPTGRMCILGLGKHRSSTARVSLVSWATCYAESAGQKLTCDHGSIAVVVRAASPTGDSRRVDPKLCSPRQFFATGGDFVDSLRSPTAVGRGYLAAQLSLLDRGANTVPRNVVKAQPAQPNPAQDSPAQHSPAQPSPTQPRPARAAHFKPMTTPASASGSSTSRVYSSP